MKIITGSLYTDWLWLSRRCQTDVSVSKSFSQDAKQTTQTQDLTTFMEEQCGRGCRSQHYVGTSEWMSSQREWKPTLHSRGTAHHTTTRLYPSTDANQVRGSQKSQGSSTQLDISSLWTSPKAKSQTIQPNTNRVMLWC